MDVENDACTAPILLSRLLPETKLIFIVRNPSERLWSDFWYTCSKRKLRDNFGKMPHAFQELYWNAPDSFHDYAMNEIEDFKKCIKRSQIHLECVMKANSEVGMLSACKKVRLGLSLYYYHLKNGTSYFHEIKF